MTKTPSKKNISPPPNISSAPKPKRKYKERVYISNEFEMEVPLPMPKHKTITKNNQDILNIDDSKPLHLGDNLKATLLMHRAFELYDQEGSWAKVAKEMKISTPVLIEHVKLYLEKKIEMDLEKQRNKMGAELDLIYKGIEQDAYEGNTSSIDRAIKLIEAKAKLFGLNAPDKQLIANVDISAETLFEQAFGKHTPAITTNAQEKKSELSQLKKDVKAGK